MLSIVELKKFGADTDEGLSRCFGNEEFYLNLVRMIPNEANFEKLETALAAKDLDAAFEAAHALKGVLANLSLTPIQEPASEITELLRARTDTDYSALLTQLKTKRDALTRICES